jgi:1-deoxy-D-xylulose-5-phosphate reductoisomerase
VLVHRTSLAHGFAIFTDGSVKAQIAPPDMRLPIGYALAYPDRLPERTIVDPFAALGAEATEASVTMVFERPDRERFPCLGLAYEALARGGTAPAALSAANEIAVEAFVSGAIRFGSIADCIAEALAAVQTSELTLDAVRAADRAARIAAGQAVERHRMEVKNA